MSEDEKLIWSGLSARLRKYYKKRHEVAHFGVGSPSDIVEGTRIAPFFTWGKERQKANKYLNHDQILVRATAFGQASRAIGWFLVTLSQRKLPLLADEQPPEEPELIVRIRALVAQRKAGLPPQPEFDLE